MSIRKIVCSVFIFLIFAAVGFFSPISGNEDIVNETPRIHNPSLEIPSSDDPDLPEGWETNAWGDNEAEFSYLEEGHTGERSIRVDITSYDDSNYNGGDAKWRFDSIKVTPGQDFRFSNYYRSDVETRVVLAVTRKDGELYYPELARLPASNSWRLHESTFTVPFTADKIAVYHILESVGYLITDDYDLSPYTHEGFKSPLLTITFDDIWNENTLTALPVMQEYGFKSTQYYPINTIKAYEDSDPFEIIMRTIDAGHEIGSHSVTHPFLTRLNAEELEHELLYSKQFLEDNLGVKVSHFAAPYGDYDEYVNSRIMRHYESHRVVKSGYNSLDNFDISQLIVQNILDHTTAEEVSSWVQKAQNDNTWLILLYHRVGDNPGDYDTTEDLFAAQMEVIADSGITVKTISEALQEVKPQLYGHVTGGYNIGVNDAIAILRHIVNLNDLRESHTYPSNAFNRARVSGKEAPSVEDAILILRYIVGLIEYRDFPVFKEAVDDFLPY